MSSEQALIGAVLQGFPVADLSVTESDFDSPTLGAVWTIFQRRASAGQPIDPIVIKDDLIAMPRMDPMIILDCISACAIPANAGHYAQQVTDAATRRSLRDFGIKAQQLSAESDRPASDLIEDARSALDRIGGRKATTIRMIADLMPDLTDQLDRGMSTGHTSPWPDLDHMIRGWHPGRLYVVGARPGIGKSILGVDAALRVARDGKHVFMASAEMPEDELGMRMIANIGKISLSTLQGTKSETDWGRISWATNALMGLPIAIDDSSQQSVASIRSQCRDLKRKGELGLIVVDYLQLLTPADRKAPRQEQVADMSRSLKVLAREMEAPVIALAQLSRAQFQRSDKTPQLSDLRESGSIEADADVVLLLHRDEPPDDYEMTVHIAKNRHGPKGQFPLMVHGHHSRLVSAQRSAS